MDKAGFEAVAQGQTEVKQAAQQRQELVEQKQHEEERRQAEQAQLEQDQERRRQALREQYGARGVEDELCDAFWSRSGLG